MGSSFASIEDIIAEARAGRMFILVDDEDRENEGDLVIPAIKADADAINFMAKYGRGLVCLALTSERVAELRLPPMASNNTARLKTAFTVSIEAREGISTGISAADRARTVAVAIDPQCGAVDLATPGHVFPLEARPGGVLVRSGHTEAAVDIARLAGLYPAGVICEIMNDDGTMARRPQLEEFARRHGLKMATIADLIAYRRRTERIITRVQSGRLNSHHGGTWDMYLYRDCIGGHEHLALVKGDISDGAPVLVRMHAFSLFDDVLGDVDRGRCGRLELAMEQIAKVGRGAVVMLCDPGLHGLAAQLDRSGTHEAEALRNYGVGAQILLDLGVRDMLLLTSTPRAVVGLEGYGLKVNGYQQLER